MFLPKRVDQFESLLKGENPDGKMPRLVNVTRTAIAIPITARFHIKNLNKVIIFGQTADQISGVISISSVFCRRISL